MTILSITVPTPDVALPKLTSEASLCLDHFVPRAAPLSTASHRPPTQTHIPGSTAPHSPTRGGAATHR
jgi:hypothetical protein